MAGAVVILGAGAALAQPPAEFFPAKQKSKWEYVVGDQKVTVEVAGEEMVGDMKCVRFVTKVGDQEKASELYAVTDKGVFRVKVKDDVVTPPVQILPAKIDKDATWDVNSKVGNQTVKGTFKVVGLNEKVKTAAGDFDAVVVEGKDFDIAGTKTTIKQWFVKDKGMVRIEFSIQNTPTVLDLKEFTAGP